MSYRMLSIALVSLLSYSAELTGLAPVHALPPQKSVPNTRGQRQLPPPIAKAIHRELADRFGISPKKLQVINARQQTWPDGCLGLAKPNEACSKALVVGWRVVVANDCQTWIYRTDSQGKILRWDQATATNFSLPQAVADAVLQDVRRRLPSLPQIIGAERRTWPDGCLGLASADVLCTQALVPGWLITGESNRQRWVYRTNESGSLVKLDEVASQTSETVPLQPVELSESELPPPLEEEVVFREISHGGITGQTHVTLLIDDGQVIHSVSGEVLQSHRLVSPLEVEQFQQLLQSQFTQLNGLSYPPPLGSADVITVTFTSQEATVQYADFRQNRLLSDLRQVIRAWNQIKSGMPE